MGRAKFSVCPCLFCLFLLQVDRAYKLINNLYCPCTFIGTIYAVKERLPCKRSADMV